MSHEGFPSNGGGSDGLSPEHREAMGEYFRDFLEDLSVRERGFEKIKDEDSLGALREARQALTTEGNADKLHGFYFDQLRREMDAVGDLSWLSKATPQAKQRVLERMRADVEMIAKLLPRMTGETPASEIISGGISTKEGTVDRLNGSDLKLLRGERRTLKEVISSTVIIPAGAELIVTGKAEASTFIVERGGHFGLRGGTLTDCKLFEVDELE